MTPVATFTLAELEAFLENAASAPPPPDYHSKDEWAALLGVTESRIGRLLRSAHLKGKLKMLLVGSTRIDGKRCSSPVYSFAVE